MDRPFDYEFVFNDSFDEYVFNQYPIVATDNDNTLQSIVSSIAAKLAHVIRVQPGIRCICTYGKHDDQTFRLTINNTNWVNLLG